MPARYFLVCLWLLAATILRESSGAPTGDDPLPKTETANDPAPTPKAGAGSGDDSGLSGGGQGSGGNPGQNDDKVNKPNPGAGSGDDKITEPNKNDNGTEKDSPAINFDPAAKLNPDNETSDLNDHQEANINTDPSKASDEKPKQLLEPTKTQMETKIPKRQPTGNPPASDDKPIPSKQPDYSSGSNQKVKDDTGEAIKEKTQVTPTVGSPSHVETHEPDKGKDDDINKNKETKKPVGETTKTTKQPGLHEHAPVTEKKQETKKASSTTTTEKTTSTSTTTETITTTESDKDEGNKGSQGEGEQVVKPADEGDKVVKPADEGDKVVKPADKGDEVVKPADKEQKTQPVLSEDYVDEFEGSSSGHFMAYFLTATVLCVAGYVIFHNKQKIIAFIIEGRSTTGGRRPSTKSYQKLKTKVDDVMPSLEKSTTSSNYVY